MEITVFTATYNRADRLRTLYDSLCRQSVKDFEWLIIDDGSEDGTEKTVEGFQGEKKIEVSYFKQENAGKHIAINKGAKEARGKWFFIVDSDDHLTDDALEKILFFCRQVEDDDRFAGVAGLRMDRAGKAWEFWYGEADEKGNGCRVCDHVDADAIEYRYMYKMSGDRAEVVRTDILKSFPFPDGSNEKFMVEGYLWLSLAKKGYRFRWFNEKIYITEYLEDGLTRNIKEHYRNSPRNSNMFFNLQLSCSGIPVKVKLKAAAKYFYYGRYGRLSYDVLIRELSDHVYLIPGLFLFKLFSVYEGLKNKKRKL